MTDVPVPWRGPRRLPQLLGKRSGQGKGGERRVGLDGLDSPGEISMSTSQWSAIDGYFNGALAR